MVSHSAAT
uniref:Uncharacterized protein n=1 Tax=Arundo donax TaxID=35708 RepID=A0A0A9B940_ARUDO